MSDLYDELVREGKVTRHHNPVLQPGNTLWTSVGTFVEHWCRKRREGGYLRVHKDLNGVRVSTS